MNKNVYALTFDPDLLRIRNPNLYRICDSARYLPKWNLITVAMLLALLL